MRRRSTSQVWGRSPSCGGDFLTYTVLASLSVIVGCGGRSTANFGTTAPSILQGPSNVSVPMGLSGNFAVSATGSSLIYQWMANGVVIPGATSDTFSTSATVFADSGTEYNVAVSNSLGSVVSSPAILTVTARAPLAGDLRFQQVDSLYTVNGYGDEGTNVSSDLLSRGGAYFKSSIGGPLVLSSADCSPSSIAGTGCVWPFQVWGLAGNTTVPSLSVGYGSDYLTSFFGDLGSSTFPVSGGLIDGTNSVITSLDFEPSNGLFAASWIQTSETSAFMLYQGSVDISGLQTIATQQASEGNVITALTYSSNQVQYLAYSWQGAPSMKFDALVQTATFATVISTAQALASEGYIITAFGGSTTDGSYIFVGTRVHGDSMPRKFVAVSATNGPVLYAQLEQPGYAVVAVIEDAQGNVTYLGER